MAGSGRIYQRSGIYFIAYSHGGREFRESSRSRNLEDAQRRYRFIYLLVSVQGIHI